MVTMGIETHDPVHSLSIHFNTLEKGWHFAAFEQSETLVDEARACMRPTRGNSLAIRRVLGPGMRYAFESRDPRLGRSRKGGAWRFLFWMDAGGVAPSAKP